MRQESTIREGGLTLPNPAACRVFHERENMKAYVLLVSIYGSEWKERARPESAGECYEIGRQITNGLNARKAQTGTTRNASFRCIVETDYDPETKCIDASKNAMAAELFNCNRPRR